MLIKRQDVIDALDRFNCCGYVEEEFIRLVEAIKAVPSAQRKGEWRPIVLTSYPAKYREMCSCCGFMKNKEAFRFCPICGADMRGEDDE